MYIHVLTFFPYFPFKHFVLRFKRLVGVGCPTVCYLMRCSNEDRRLLKEGVFPLHLRKWKKLLIWFMETKGTPRNVIPRKKYGFNKDLTDEE